MDKTIVTGFMIVVSVVASVLVFNALYPAILQSTDAMVNRVTPKLFASAPTPEKMVTLSVDEIREMIKPCGLSPQKSVAIYELSKILIEKHNGQVPDNYADLEALPGVTSVGMINSLPLSGSNAFSRVAIEGVSLVITYRASFNEEIRSNGLDALIARLRAKNLEESR